jgi:hypothetical protein
MNNKFFDRIYKYTPQQSVDELLAFRLTHPIQQKLIDGMEWNYILSGNGSETIVIVGGPLSTPEMHYRS